MTRFALLIGIISLFFCARAYCEEANDKQVTTVLAKDIPDKVQIIGELGQPLGKLTTIRGKWIKPSGVPKDNSLRFQITAVNGKRLDKSVEWHRTQVIAVFSGEKGRGPKPGEKWDWQYVYDGKSLAPKPEENENWEMQGAEIGGFDIHVCLSTLEGMQLPYYRKPFSTHFEFIAVKKINDDGKADSKR